jgi:hypothetical protein
MIPGLCSAADIYLDIAATGCTGGGVANTNYDPVTRSCGSGTGKVYAGNYPYEAGQSLQNGDTLYIRAGEYWEDVTGKPGYTWTVGALYIYPASNVIIKNYNGEVVWVKGGASRTTPQYHPNNAVTLAGSNIMLDGINVYGCIIMAGTSNTIQNCDLSGGFDHQAPWNVGTPDAAWPNVIRFMSSLNALVRNCRMHDNVMPPAGGNNSNMSLIMHEHDSNTIIENSHFYNSCAGFAYIKYQDSTLRSLTQATYRYNVFDGPNGGFEMAAQFWGQYDYMYQNIFTKAPAQFMTRTQPLLRYIKIYNNTFYDVDGAVFAWTLDSAGNYEFFNNIVYADSGTLYAIDFSQASGSLSSGYFDYNLCYASGAGSLKWGYSGSYYTTMGSWSSLIGSGAGTEDSSLATNPNFMNSSGSFSQFTDFKRTSYPQNGRGGIWPLVMGAYVTGNEIIGPSGSLRAAPSPPMKLR